MYKCEVFLCQLYTGYTNNFVLALRNVSCFSNQHAMRHRFISLLSLQGPAFCTITSIPENKLARPLNLPTDFDC